MNPTATPQKETTKMEFGANKQSKHAARRLAALYRMFKARQATNAVLSQVRRDAKTSKYNLNNKPLGATNANPA